MVVDGLLRTVDCTLSLFAQRAALVAPKRASLLGLGIVVICSIVVIAVGLGSGRRAAVRALPVLISGLTLGFGIGQSLHSPSNTVIRMLRGQVSVEEFLVELREVPAVPSAVVRDYQLLTSRVDARWVVATDLVGFRALYVNSLAKRNLWFRPDLELLPSGQSASRQSELVNRQRMLDSALIDNSPTALQELCKERVSHFVGNPSGRFAAHGLSFVEQRPESLELVTESFELINFGCMQSK